MEKELLREIGLTEYQTKIYLALIEKGELTASEIAKESKVPQPKVYSSLEKLKENSLIEILPDYPKKYKAINPSTSIPHLIKERQKKLEKIAKKTTFLIKKLEKKYNKKSREEKEAIWILQKGKEEFLERIIGLIKESKKEILFLTLHFTIYPELKKELEKAVKRGVKVKVIGEITQETKDRSEEYKEIGCEIKNRKHKYPRFSVFDNKKIILRVGKQYRNIILEDKEIANFFKKAFIELWNKKQ